MGAVLGILVGITLAGFGFAVMRNPMRLNLLPFNPGAEGYFQGMVFDAPTRNGMRMLGAVICLFGSSIFTAAIGAVLRLPVLQTISDGLWTLLNCVFITAFVSGLILSVWQTFRGQTFNWFQAWKEAAELGPIEVFPPITPKMQREARIFTMALLTLVFIAALASVMRYLCRKIAVTQVIQLATVVYDTPVLAN